MHERKTIFGDWSGTESSLVLVPMGTGPLLVDLELVETMGAARVMPPGPEEIRKGKWRGYQVRYAGVLLAHHDSDSRLGMIQFADAWLAGDYEFVVKFKGKADACEYAEVGLSSIDSDSEVESFDGNDYAYGIQAGRYFLDGSYMDNRCSWTVRIKEFAG